MRKWSYNLQNKSECRQFFLSNRLLISEDRQFRASLAATDIFQNALIFKNSQHIGCYFSLPDEFKTEHLIQLIISANKCCYLPKLLKSEKKLLFYSYDLHTPLVKNEYQIWEPEIPNPFPSEKLDLVLLPLVAADRKGNRLGRGGGYYDKTFSFLSHNDKIKHPFLLGLCFEEQVTDHLPSDPWDIQLDGILSEKQLLIFNHLI